MSRLILTGLAVFILVFAFSSPRSLFAQNSAGLTLSPILIEEEVSSGQVLSQRIKVTNNDSVAHTYYINTRDVKDIDAYGVPIFSEPGEEIGFGLSSWIRVQKDSILVSSGGTGEFTATISVPRNVSPGAHFGAIYVSLTPKRPNASGSGTGFDVHTIISLNVAGKVVDSAQVYSLTASRFLFNQPEVDFEVTVASVGNTLVRPVGAITITDMFGKSVATIDVNRSGAGIVPGGRRAFSAHWSGSGFSFGRYSATLGMTYGSEQRGKQSLSARTNFWVLPLRVIGPILGAMLVFSLIVFGIARLHVRRNLKGVAVRSRRRQTSRLATATLFLILFLIGFLVMMFTLFA